MKKIITLTGLAMLLFSCNVAEQLAGTYTMTQCKYDYKSITELTLAGINMQNVKSITSLNLVNTTNLLAAFSSTKGSLPLNFTLNLDVSNPSAQTALLNGVAYILEIDGIEMTQGLMNAPFRVGAGEKTVLPINMSFDLKQTMSGQALNAIKDLAFNFVGIGEGASNVTVRLKPNFSVGGRIISSPAYIPVSFVLKK